jgi:PIN domain nuclease of toxin-antitoxin system
MFHAVADTHTIIWYIFADKRLSPSAQMVIDDAAANGDQIAFSSITLAEIIYLGEKD